MQNNYLYFFLFDQQYGIIVSFHDRHVISWKVFARLWAAQHFTPNRMRLRIFYHDFLFLCQHGDEKTAPTQTLSRLMGGGGTPTMKFSYGDIKLNHQSLSIWLMSFHFFLGRTR